MIVSGVPVTYVGHTGASNKATVNCMTSAIKRILNVTLIPWQHIRVYLFATTTIKITHIRIASVCYLFLLP